MNHHKPRSRWKPLAIAFIACSAIFCAQQAIHAHPVAQGAMHVGIFPDHVAVEMRVSLEEVMVAATTAKTTPASFEDGLKQHGAYLLQHVHIAAGGRALTGSLKRSEAMKKPDGTPDERALYEFDYVCEKPAPAIDLSEDVLNEITYAPGNNWEASYIVSITQQNGGSQDGVLLSRKDAVHFDCDWSGRTNGSQMSASTAFWRFCNDGIWHILTGYDHLLFVSSLILAAATLWDLFKVVLAFTIAHGLTLTLSVLDILRLPSNIVEPMIAASIVFVSVQNIFFPRTSSGKVRMAVAFFFGLFHGLGFAGGLLEAMEGMPGTALAAALIAFSLGVEIGHQMVVLPLYGVLRMARASRPNEESSRKAFAQVRTYASAVISVAGLFYFCAALGWLGR
jgi:hydrogenase/urease accessory protein HupE